MTCPKNERCELKDTTRYVGVPIESPLDYKYRELPIHTADPFYDRDYNLCIVCGRCVRACDELRGDNAITFVERAGKPWLGPPAAPRFWIWLRVLRGLPRCLSGGALLSATTVGEGGPSGAHYLSSLPRRLPAQLGDQRKGQLCQSNT